MGDSSEDEQNIESVQVEATRKNKDKSAIAALMNTMYADTVEAHSCVDSSEIHWWAIRNY